MKLVKEKAKDIKQSYDDLISTPLSITHFDYQFYTGLTSEKLRKMP
jgi:hypothetical protein